MFHFINWVSGALVLLLSWKALKVALSLKRKQRLLADTPTSKALGVFIGEVEVSGVCVSQAPLISSLALAPCVYYRWQVVEHCVRGSGDNRYSDEEVVASGFHSAGFYLEDETGSIWVNPTGAEVEARRVFKKLVSRRDPLYYGKGPSNEVHSSKGLREFTEYALCVGTKVFIRGRASERPEVVAAQIGHDGSAGMFIISYRGERSISVWMGWKANAWDFVGAFAAINAVVVASAGLGPVLLVYAAFGAALSGERTQGTLEAVPYIPLGLLIGVGLYLLAAVVGWARMVFNSMVGLRNRVAQAYSLIDVQLKRRTDLIERFVACVQGFREHEAAVQAMVTAMRAQADGGSLKALAPGILAVIESYPEIRAQALFNDLSKQLIETEDRIALARGYHNSIATFYNTRLETIPDRYLAGLVKMKPASLFEAEGFTHRPATVAF